MNLARANTLYRNPSTHKQVNLDGGPIPWNRRLDTFKTIQQNSASLGPQEEEIEKIYGQIHYWVELLNDKFGTSMQKKEENCMIAFKKVMLSIEKDLKDLRQQVDDSQKITRDTSEDDAFTNLQKQLAFFRSESINLSKKLKAAEDQIKELKKKNKDLQDDAEQDHQQLLQSHRERKALKTLLLTAGTLKYTNKNHEGSGPSSAFSSRQMSRQGNEWYESKLSSDANFESRRSSGLNLGSVTERRNKMSRTSSSSQSKSVESRYKKENLHLNSLKDQLEQTLRKNAGFLNSDKASELVKMVTAIVMKHIQAQDQQLNTLNSKIMRIKKFYQSLLKNQLGAEIPSSLYEILFIFSDVFSSYRGRDGLDNIVKLTARMGDNDSIGFYKTEIPSYRHPDELDGANRSSILESIRGINEKYGKLGNQDKVQIMQKILNDPSVGTLLTNYVESSMVKTRGGGETSPGHKLVSTKETSSHPHSPAGKKFLESEVEERHGQLNNYRDNYYFAKTNSQKMDNKPPLLDIRSSLSSLPMKKESYDASNDRSLPIQSFREVDSVREYKGNSMEWGHVDSRENRNSTFKDSHSFGHLECSDGMDVSFSTPVDVPRQRTVGDNEIRMPAGEEKPVKDFRKKFLVRAGKALES